MATLQNIRNKSGLLLAVIGIAMLAFILGDLLKSTNSGGGNSMIVGEVLGENILIQKFQSKVDDGIENWKIQNQGSVLNQSTTAQIRDQIWNQYIKDLVMDKEFQELGITVSDDEFFELLQGMNVHPEISKVASFQNPETGQFDRTRVLSYLKQIDQDQTGDARTRWLGFQEYLIGLIKTSKYNSLLSKAMFTTNEEARIELNSINKFVRFDYVAIPFSSVDDEIQITDDELEKYYSKHKFKYEQEASKDVDFVVYSVVPSLEDDVKTKAEISDLIADFESEDDYILMARRNSDNTNSRFVYSTEDGLQDDSKWKELYNSKKGTVIGPYLSSQGVYRIAKLAELEYRPDSVEARHILINPTQTMSLDSVNKKIDDLKLAIESGADFGVLAKKNSEDQGSAIKGGDLGWFSEGQMVDEFNEVCFTSKKGDLSIVQTQFGVHLIEVTNKSKAVKKIKVAYIDRKVEPSTETYNSYYSKAAQFAGMLLNEGTPFDTLITINNLVKRTDKKVGSNKQNISGLANSREMVRWMHNAEVNSVSEVFQFDNSYVVAYITDEYFQGVAELEQIKEQITALIIKEKKALKILEGIVASDLVSIASANSTKVVNDQKATFSNLSIEGIGFEPELVGSLFANKLDSVSSPIIGRNAVYVVQVVSIDESVSNEDFIAQKLNMQKQAISYVNNASYNALKEAANLKDYRVDFY